MRFTMILRTADFKTVNFHRFVNLWFYNDFLRVRKWGFVNLDLQSSLKTIRGCFQMSLKISFGCFTMILRTADLRHGNLHRFVN